MDHRKETLLWILTCMMILSTIRHWSDISFTMVTILSSVVLTKVGPKTMARFRASICNQQVDQGEVNPPLGHYSLHLYHTASTQCDTPWPWVTESWSTSFYILTYTERQCDTPWPWVTESWSTSFYILTYTERQCDTPWPWVTESWSTSFYILTYTERQCDTPWPLGNRIMVHFILHTNLHRETQ